MKCLKSLVDCHSWIMPENSMEAVYCSSSSVLFVTNRLYYRSNHELRYDDFAPIILLPLIISIAALAGIGSEGNFTCFSVEITRE